MPFTIDTKQKQWGPLDEAKMWWRTEARPWLQTPIFGEEGLPSAAYSGLVSGLTAGAIRPEFEGETMPERVVETGTNLMAMALGLKGLGAAGKAAGAAKAGAAGIAKFGLGAASKLQNPWVAMGLYGMAQDTGLDMGSPEDWAARVKGGIEFAGTGFAMHKVSKFAQPHIEGFLEKAAPFWKQAPRTYRDAALHMVDNFGQMGALSAFQAPSDQNRFEAFLAGGLGGALGAGLGSLPGVKMTLEQERAVRDSFARKGMPADRIETSVKNIIRSPDMKAKAFEEWKAYDAELDAQRKPISPRERMMGEAQWDIKPTIEETIDQKLDQELKMAQIFAPAGKPNEVAPKVVSQDPSKQIEKGKQEIVQENKSKLVANVEQIFRTDMKLRDVPESVKRAIRKAVEHPDVTDQESLIKHLNDSGWMSRVTMQIAQEKDVIEAKESIKKQTGISLKVNTQNESDIKKIAKDLNSKDPKVKARAKNVVMQEKVKQEPVKVVAPKQEKRVKGKEFDYTRNVEDVIFSTRIPEGMSKDTLDKAVNVVRNRYPGTVVEIRGNQIVAYKPESLKYRVGKTVEPRGAREPKEEVYEPEAKPVYELGEQGKRPQAKYSDEQVAFKREIEAKGDGGKESGVFAVREPETGRVMLYTDKAKAIVAADALDGVAYKIDVPKTIDKSKKGSIIIDAGAEPVVGSEGKLKRGQIPAPDALISTQTGREVEIGGLVSRSYLTPTVPPGRLDAEIKRISGSEMRAEQRLIPSAIDVFAVKDIDKFLRTYQPSIESKVPFESITDLQTSKALGALSGAGKIKGDELNLLLKTSQAYGNAMRVSEPDALTRSTNILKAVSQEMLMSGRKRSLEEIANTLYPIKAEGDPVKQFKQNYPIFENFNPKDKITAGKIYASIKRIYSTMWRGNKFQVEAPEDKPMSAKEINSKLDAGEEITWGNIKDLLNKSIATAKPMIGKSMELPAGTPSDIEIIKRVLGETGYETKALNRAINHLVTKNITELYARYEVEGKEKVDRLNSLNASISDIGVKLERDIKEGNLEKAVINMHKQQVEDLAKDVLAEVTNTEKKGMPQYDGLRFILGDEMKNSREAYDLAEYLKRTKAQRAKFGGLLSPKTTIVGVKVDEVFRAKNAELEAKARKLIGKDIVVTKSNIDVIRKAVKAENKESLNNIFKVQEAMKEKVAYTYARKGELGVRGISTRDIGTDNFINSQKSKIELLKRMVSMMDGVGMLADSVAEPAPNWEKSMREHRLSGQGGGRREVGVFEEEEGIAPEPPQPIEEQLRHDTYQERMRYDQADNDTPASGLDVCSICKPLDKEERVYVDMAVLGKDKKYHDIRAASKGEFWTIKPGEEEKSYVLSSDTGESFDITHGQASEILARQSTHPEDFTGFTDDAVGFKTEPGRDIYRASRVNEWKDVENQIVFADRVGHYDRQELLGKIVDKDYGWNKIKEQLDIPDINLKFREAVEMWYVDDEGLLQKTNKWNPTYDQYPNIFKNQVEQYVKAYRSSLDLLIGRGVFKSPEGVIEKYKEQGFYHGVYADKDTHEMIGWIGGAKDINAALRHKGKGIGPGMEQLDPETTLKAYQIKIANTLGMDTTYRTLERALGPNGLPVLVYARKAEQLGLDLFDKDGNLLEGWVEAPDKLSRNINGGWSKAYINASEGANYSDWIRKGLLQEGGLAGKIPLYIKGKSLVKMLTVFNPIAIQAQVSTNLAKSLGLRTWDALQGRWDYNQLGYNNQKALLLDFAKHTYSSSQLLNEFSYSLMDNYNNSYDPKSKNMWKRIERRIIDQWGLRDMMFKQIESAASIVWAIKKAEGMKAGMDKTQAGMAAGMFVEDMIGNPQKIIYSGFTKDAMNVALLSVQQQMSGFRMMTNALGGIEKIGPQLDKIGKTFGRGTKQLLGTYGISADPTHKAKLHEWYRGQMLYQAFTYAIMGGLVTKMMSGIFPWERADKSKWFDIGTGVKDPSGNEIIVQPPFYKELRDVFAAVTNPRNYMVGKMDPSLKAMIEVLVGQEITPSDVRPFAPKGAGIGEKIGAFAARKAINVVPLLKPVIPGEIVQKYGEFYPRQDWERIMDVAGLGFRTGRGYGGVGEEANVVYKRKQIQQQMQAEHENLRNDMERAWARGDTAKAKKIAKDLYAPGSFEKSWQTFVLRHTQPLSAKGKSKELRQAWSEAGLL